MRLVCKPIGPHIARLALTCFAVAVTTGCGSDRPLVPVSGRVTYAGGDWPIQGTITFGPKKTEDGKIPRLGSANFDKEGNFEVGSYQPGDGLMPGTYKVTVSCISSSDPSKTVEELDLVPQTFKPEDLVVEAGSGPIELNLDVPKKE
jgi:hypothetical protein